MLGDPSMKLSIAIILMAFIPLQAFAMDPITDDEMNTITGAVGVHIYVEGELTQPTYQVLQWRNHPVFNGKKQSLKQVNKKKSDIYEISYVDCELRFDSGNSDQNIFMNEDNAVITNRSIVKVGSPTETSEISTGNIHLSFQEISVNISKAPEAIHIIPR